MVNKTNDRARLQLGNKLKKAREKAGLTQVEVAAKTDMTDNYYAMIERGEVTTSIEKLQRIADAMGVSNSRITNSK